MLTTSPSLLERLRDPSESAAWEKFVELYTPLLFSWTKRLGLHGNDAADLVQDIFVVLIERLPQFQYQPGRSFRAWLRTVLLNRWRNLQERRKPRVGLPHDVAEPVADSLFEEAEYRQYLVQRALAIMQVDFDTQTWKACWEFVVAERPAADVARELGVSINTIYLAKSRVVRRLRQELNGLL